MSKCPKCGSVNVRMESGRLEGATMGAPGLFFDVYICEGCSHSGLYFQEKSYLCIAY